MQLPEDLRYTKEHEWVRLDGGEAIVGITDFAQDSLGDIVFVELPALGTQLAQGETFGVVESNKSVSDLFCPIAGRVVAVNEALRAEPERVNQDPYGDGWMIRLAASRPEDVAALLDANGYAAHVAAQKGA
jgi:glycine cleavage system H protein